MEPDGRLARGEASRAAILQAATHVVASHGIQALTHRAVAAKLGIPHARVAYHFASADSLRGATLTHAGNQILDRLGLLMGDTPDPSRVPQMAGQLAIDMVTTLHDETVTLYTLMAEATHDEQLREDIRGITHRIACIVEPLSGSRQIASMAASALLGFILIAMAEGKDSNPETIRTQAIDLVNRFDPHIDPSTMDA